MTTPGFFVASFVLDGELEGVRRRSLSELSPKWLAFCHELLTTQGATFRCLIPVLSLEHISVQVTSKKGTALITFSVRNEPASSAAALGGVDSTADVEVLRMFVDSLRQIPLVKQAAASPLPFEGAFGIAERPLYIVVPWANTGISDADMQLVQELQNHLAGALLARAVAS